MLNLATFNTLQCGLHLVTTAHAGHTAGCVINTAVQATVTPAQMIVIVNKQNRTAQLMQESGVFAVTPLAQSASMELIGLFGFQRSSEVDKFAPYAVKTDENGVPYVCEQVTSRFSCRIVQTMDAGTHLVFLGETTHTEELSTETPLTYADYHAVKKGLTPPTASSYIPPQQAEAKKGYRCKVCGYVLESDTLPADFICPICKKGAEAMEPIV